MSTLIQEPTAEELAELIGFEPDEVKLNSAGKYSERQIKRLRFWSVCITIISLALIFLVKRSLPCLPECFAYASFVDIIRITGSSAVILIFLFGAARAVIFKPPVRSRTGYMTTNTGMVWSIRPRALFVKDMGFDTGWANRRLIMPKLIYEGYVKIYYCDVIPYIVRPILSIEPLDSSEERQKD